uniref:Chromosome 1 open reading frame 116 n=1 Tax=Leptobrachium leishanense TaxID=445787 RepID=A0A8C5MY96_9ANUR
MGVQIYNWLSCPAETNSAFCNLLWVMPEKFLSTRHVGMEPLGSTGSCDSMESISSYHSGFSWDDHLSAEERECLLFLEETIDSLDNEIDSGLSNDESEPVQIFPNPPSVPPPKIPLSNGDGKTSAQNKAVSKTEKKPDHASVNLNKGTPPRLGYHSFPRIIQGPKEDAQKHPAESGLIDPNKNQEKSSYGKPKSMTSINKPDTEDSISDLLLPPPEPFQDTQFVDKRRSVTDPTDVRESRYESFLPRASVYREAPPGIGPSNIKVTPPLVYPKPMSSNPLITYSQEALNAEKQEGGQVRPGPPTAPKPRKLPSHIIVKPSTGGGLAVNLDPQQRPRTFSAHERNTEKSGEAVKLPQHKEPERARQEALKKLGLLQGNAKTEDRGSNKPTMMPKTEGTSVSSGMMLPGQQDAYGKSVSHQEKSDVLGKSPVKSSALDAQTDNMAIKDVQRKRLSMKSPSEKSDGSVGNHVLNEDSQSVKSDISRSRSSVKLDPQRKADHIDGPSHPPIDRNVNLNIGRNPSIANANTPLTVQGQQAYPSTAIPKVNKPDEIRSKEGSLDNIPLSTSPGKPFSFPRPKEVTIPSIGSGVVLRQEKNKAVDLSNRHSSHFEPAGEEVLRLPESSVPGLRQINIKSNTLERSGIGLSSSVASNDGQTQKGGGFFKKNIFHGNLLRNSRPRPASLGTGKDFAGMDPPPTETEVTEGRRSLFSRSSRTPPVTSVKITPKGSTDEHRREALKKLGILKE